MSWIKCTDKLPDESGYYLVWASTGQICSGHFAKKAEQWGSRWLPRSNSLAAITRTTRGFLE